jgi:hypothetical protein
MIPVPSGVRVWLAVGRTDMRRGMNGLELWPKLGDGSVRMAAYRGGWKPA